MNSDDDIRSSPDIAPSPAGTARPAVVTAASTVGMRNLERSEIELGAGINVAYGENGAGKTNLLEALALSLTGRSPRTRNDREIISFSHDLLRIETRIEIRDGDSVIDTHVFSYAADGSGERRHLVDGSAVTLEALGLRPPVSVFMPDRMSLVKGTPAGRRAHLDRFWMALWPARSADRGRFTRALTQRNALLSRVAAGYADPAELDAWDRELASASVPLVANRSEAIARLGTPFTQAAAALGVEDATITYRPRVEADSVDEYVAELAERRPQDIRRGFTTRGAHLDEVRIALGPRQLRRFGSQGQQRIALLALLFAERDVLVGADRPPPLMLLDDVLSELDVGRRDLLFDFLESRPGQSLITTTGLDLVPEGRVATLLRVEAGTVTRVDGSGDGN